MPKLYFPPVVGHGLCHLWNHSIFQSRVSRSDSRFIVFALVDARHMPRLPKCARIDDLLLFVQLLYV